MVYVSFSLAPIDVSIGGKARGSERFTAGCAAESCVTDELYVLIGLPAKPVSLC